MQGEHCGHRSPNSVKRLKEKSRQWWPTSMTSGFSPVSFPTSSRYPATVVRRADVEESSCLSSSRCHRGFGSDMCPAWSAGAFESPYLCSLPLWTVWGKEDEWMRNDFENWKIWKILKIENEIGKSKENILEKFGSLWSLWLFWLPFLCSSFLNWVWTPIVLIQDPPGGWKA